MSPDVPTRRGGRGWGARGGLRAPHPGGRRRTTEGAVTAETAAVLPVLAAVGLAFAWLLGLGVEQLRLVDAARETARAVARGEQPEAATRLGLRVAPSGSRISMEADDGLVRVRVATDVAPARGLLGFLGSVQLDAEAVTARERP